MKRLLRFILLTLLTLAGLAIIWIIGLFAGFPLIPSTETIYYVNESEQTLASGFVLNQTDSTIIKLEVPNYFLENDQCFDVWLSSTKGEHILSIEDYSLQGFITEQKELPKENTFLFWDNGNKENTFTVDNYKISKAASSTNDKYVFIRTVFDTEMAEQFTLVLKINYQLNQKNNLIEQKINVKKEHTLNWNSLKVH
jgi:lipopolysaccharide assembly outer membrane protein LptD (OstA)